MIDEKETNGGLLGDIPNDKYRKFLTKAKEHPTVDVGVWKPVHLIGYFCDKYQTAYDKQYQFKFNSPSPARSFEVFQIKKLGQILSSNPSIVKDYIDWAFEIKVEKEKRKFTSISFLTREEIIKEYKMTHLLQRQIDRSTLLPSNFRTIFADCGSINTYGDLAFWQRAVGDREDFKSAFNLAIAAGLDPNILKEIK